MQVQPFHVATFVHDLQDEISLDEVERITNPRKRQLTAVARETDDSFAG